MLIIYKLGLIWVSTLVVHKELNWLEAMCLE